MRRTIIDALKASTLVLVILAGCTMPRTAAPDTQATVDAAIAATSAAQASTQATAETAPGTQATIDAAVAATSTAQADLQATVDAAAAATRAAEPESTPAAEYVAMSEEELATLIDQAVNEATAASQQYSTAATEAAADDALTAEEIDELQIYVSGAEEAIALAEELIEAYDDLYGELAAETLDLSVALEEDLSVLAENAAAMEALLEKVDTALQQGEQLAQATIAQLQTAAQKTSANAAQIQAQAHTRIEQHQGGLQDRVAGVLAVQPDDVAADPQAALQGAFEYVDTVRQALGDDKVSDAELAQIAQLGANASAGLSVQGGPRLQPLLATIDDITGQVACGELAQATASLQRLEALLDSQPAALPELSVPDKPSRPSRP
jgi:hypothetical protein